MPAFEPLDPRMPLSQQLDESVSPAVLVNVFTVDPSDADALLAAWEADANWMKQQPGYISTQLHRGIAGSSVFMNYAVWESVAHFRAAFTNPEFASKLRAYPSSVTARPHLFTRVAVPNLCTD
ncbi:antibiotic biosynthesis monooxygenase family protein [Paraburkholderia sp. GAS42]|uniref:antibiotic biosynthesis monooxygenase family protein n=1 Tax=Paraburkholderia sp. GAS42 TaxID=3035135 RepID=UPI003D1D371A